MLENRRDSRSLGFVQIDARYDGKSFLTRLNHVFGRVVKIGEGRKLHGYITKRAKTGSHVGKGQIRRRRLITRLPTLCRWRFKGEVRNVSGLTIADNQISTPVDNRRHELVDITTKMLVVPVGVDDDVSPKRRQASKPALNTSLALCSGKRHVICTPHSRATSLVRSVEPSSMTNTSTRSIPGLTRHITDGRQQRLFLIQAGYLHDQFQIIFCSLSGLTPIGLRADRPKRMPGLISGDYFSRFGLSAPARVLSFRRHLSMMRPSF